MELFKLFGRVLVETSDADKSLEKIDNAAKSGTKNVGSYVDKIKQWAGVLKTAVAASAVVKGLKEIVSISADVAAQGDAIDKASQKLGVSAKFYQEWAYVLERNGTTIDQVGEAIFELSEKVAKGDENVLATFERIGVGVDEIVTATPEELWQKAIDGLFQIDSLSERAAISTELFGDKSKQLGPLLNTSAEDVKALKDRVNDLGGVMDNSLVAKSAAYTDAVTDLKMAWQGFKNDLAENTIPGMTQMVTGFTDMLTGEFIPGLEQAGAGIASFFQGALATLYSYTESVWQTIASKIEEMQYGLGSVFGLDKASVDAGVKSYYEDEFQLPSGEWVTQSELDDRFRHANGIPFIPRDNYPANLHYGERVLTRQEAEEYNSGKSFGGGFVIHQNITTVPQSPAQLAAASAAAFEIARWRI